MQEKRKQNEGSVALVCFTTAKTCSRSGDREMTNRASEDILRDQC